MIIESYHALGFEIGGVYMMSGGPWRLTKVEVQFPPEVPQTKYIYWFGNKL